MVLLSCIVFCQKKSDVKFAICNDVVGTVHMFDTGKKFVQSIQVYKQSTNLPQHLKKYEYLADNGLAEVKLKKQYGLSDSMSLQEFNIQNGISQNTPVLIEGYKFENPATHIFSDIIDEITTETLEGRKILVITTKK
ncbi:hypothetical protein AB670_00271 [Chryseobacterium sp. MOF25P]|nr:hypothetical protein AB670_00271 [Chryseobacterium sp. MOF25P]OBW46988.1 hypothetical protein AB671_00864 [Chryseobacterium sp. BGARF1]